MLSEKVSILPEFRHSPAYLRSEQATQSRPCGWNGNGGGISTGGVGAGGEERRKASAGSLGGLATPGSTDLGSMRHMSP